MSVWSLYSISDGLFNGSTITCSNDQLDINVASGFSCILGEFDYLSQRVDLDTGEVVDYIPEQPSINHVWDATTKRWVYVPTLEDRKAEKVREINDICSSLLGSIKSSYPSDEVQSWSKQESEARSLLIDSESPAPLLKALAEARGIPLDLLVVKVIAKADMFASISGNIIGKRQFYEKQIESATSVDDLLNINWQ